MAFERIFRRERLQPAIVEGDGFHRYSRAQMDRVVVAAEHEGRNMTHFGPEGNLFAELDQLFREYGKSGTGRRRYYIHNEEEAARRGAVLGALTDWEPLPQDTDLLFYEGLHGGLVTKTINVARHVNLLIGVTPIINLEWMQKIHRDRALRGYSSEAAIRMILSRMRDYVHYIVPQFSITDINFQRVPTVDTSNPFLEMDVPTHDQSFSVIHVRNTNRIRVDFRYLLEMIEASFISAPDTIVVPEGKKMLAMQLIIAPALQRLIRARHRA